MDSERDSVPIENPTLLSGRLIPAATLVAH